MGEVTAIAWTDGSGNTHVGCQEVRLYVKEAEAKAIEDVGQIVMSEVSTSGVRRFWVPSECDNCYAKVYARTRLLGRMDGRDAEHPLLWGNPKLTPRHETRYWPYFARKMDRKALHDGGRLMVFSNSLSDLFEEHWQVAPWREGYLRTLPGASNVDFLLLTKRIQNVMRMIPREWIGNWPRNVWIGTSAGTQRAWDLRVPYFEEIIHAGCQVTFVSYEPSLGPINGFDALKHRLVRWSIGGGESGNGEDRPRIEAATEWFRSMRDQCAEAGAPYFHKQGSGRRPGMFPELDGRLWHQWPDTALGQVAGVRADRSAELIPLRERITA